MMSFEERCLAIVADVTNTRAYFSGGALYLQTHDSAIAVRVYSALSINNSTVGIIFGKCGDSETVYEFV